jgi:EVE domain
MRYYLDLFTPETWAAFRKNGSGISGFREKQRKTAERIEPGDVFLCYMVRLSRWCGVLEVTSKHFTDTKPIFSDPDPFVVRFQVKPLVQLDLEQSIPMLDEHVWSQVSFTEGIKRGVVGWAQFLNLRASLREINAADGKILQNLLGEQVEKSKPYPLSATDKQRLGLKSTVRTVDRSVVVEIPGEEAEETAGAAEVGPAAQLTNDDLRESLKVQATISRIGAEMGFRIWVPKSDKQRVIDQVRDDIRPAFLDVLPLNYDDNTLRTVEQIDVIWMKGRSMARAFEIEHTTAIYSGLLRMADLLALQPNMDIRLHIVAPDEKREKVLREIRRPVFSLLEKGPLYESCSYISYDAIKEISEMKHLHHTTDSILDEYEELAQDE